MRFWGWIPTLDPGYDAEPLPFVGNGQDSRTVIIEDTLDSDGCFVSVGDRTGTRTVLRVDVVDNMVTFDCQDGTLSREVFRAVKRMFHMDRTHDTSAGIVCVQAEDRTTAVRMILDQFGTFLRRGDEITEPNYMFSSSDYLRHRGMVDYGLSFIERYRDTIGETDYAAYREMLTSHGRYIGTRLDLQRGDRHDRHSEFSRGNGEAVIALTLFSVVMAVHTLLSGHGYYDGALWDPVALLLAVSPFIRLYTGRLVRDRIAD